MLSRAKHRSLAGHSRIAKRLARWIRGYAYDDEEFFAVDGAPAEVAQMRRAGFERLSALYQVRFARSLAATAQAREVISDLQFTGSYRVPFQFSRRVRQSLGAGAFLQASRDVRVQDLDGNWLYDLTGSYGVNLLGYDVYKQTIAEGNARAAELGPVLGAYHPCVLSILQRLRAISGLQEVSFHMSGTEAVMQAVRLARYHTRRRYLARFAGAYNGWWEDVQPGPGNPLPPRDTYTLAEMSERSLQVLRSRGDIACVIVNPLQALHPNRAAPGDSQLVDGSRHAQYDRAAYTRWLQDLRAVCTERGIVLILDEVFLGFRLDPRGAQGYFGVQADMVTYGKTLGGGLPVGVVCGRADLMKRFREERPADLCFARGTFNAHPYVMGAMSAFLERIEQPDVLSQAQTPLRVVHMSTVCTVLYTQPGRYHWMLQYYLRAHGLALSWVGSGRLIFSLNYSEAEFDEVARRFVAAARQMLADGWWHAAPGLTRRSIRLGIMREMFARKQ
jgi:glutamate-1-semialdehyde 2,1-aminomutase